MNVAAFRYTSGTEHRSYFRVYSESNLFDTPENTTKRSQMAPEYSYQLGKLKTADDRLEACYAKSCA